MRMKPCPFCGCTEIIPITDIESGTDRPISMCCAECEAQGPPSYTEADARMRWNAHKKESSADCVSPVIPERFAMMIACLRHGGQADEDGVLVKVSRQACEEAADFIERECHRACTSEDNHEA